MRTAATPSTPATVGSAWLLAFLYIASIVVLFFCRLVSADVHDVPGLQQSGPNDCGPTAAASCLKWFQQNAYPDLKTRGGSSAIRDFKQQLQTDAGTDDRGTRSDKLVGAINKLIDTGPNDKPGAYKGQLRAKGPPNKQAYEDFGHLDTEFGKSQNIILLFSYGSPEESHYVTVRNLTGSGDSRKLEFMDPATGAAQTLTLTKQDGKLALTYNGKAGRISGIIHVSPAHTTESSDAAPVDANDPDKGVKIDYTLFFPPSEVARDLHIWVTDCLQANYDVRGLPQGWKFKVQTVTVNGKERCYLSIYRDSSTKDIANGATITVIYAGVRRPRKSQRVIIQTTSGTDDPASGASPAENGTTVFQNVPRPPGRPTTALLALAGVPSVRLRWPPSADTPERYDIFETDTTDPLASSRSARKTLAQLEPAILHRLVVVARNRRGFYSQDSPEASILHTTISAGQGSPTEIRFAPPQTSWHAGDAWVIQFTKDAKVGALVLTELGAQPHPPLPRVAGTVVEPFYHLSTDSRVAGRIRIAVPYSRALFPDQSKLRLYQLRAQGWRDITSEVDAEGGRIFGEMKGLGTFALVNSTPRSTSRAKR